MVYEIYLHPVKKNFTASALEQLSLRWSLYSGSQLMTEDQHLLNEMAKENIPETVGSLLALRKYISQSNRKNLSPTYWDLLQNLKRTTCVKTTSALNSRGWISYTMKKKFGKKLKVNNNIVAYCNYKKYQITGFCDVYHYEENFEIGQFI